MRKKMKLVRAQPLKKDFINLFSSEMVFFLAENKQANCVQAGEGRPWVCSMGKRSVE